jgi:hypothetical protein
MREDYDKISLTSGQPAGKARHHPAFGSTAARRAL